MEELRFISAAVIERLETGAFVPARRSHPNLQMADRRNMVSPLAVTRRCIRYDPNIFHHRKSQVLQLAHSLNDPAKKILLVGGPQGSGKTSLIRGVIELLGGEVTPTAQSAQLLWFDVNRHTDFEEIIQFLIQYITYIASAAEQLTEAGQVELPAEPIKRLEALISRVRDLPLLIVLDNVEYIVNPELRFNSYPFKEMLNFLLGFPNIKMILCGERLPYADMSPNQEGVEELKLAGLQESDMVSFLQHRIKTSESAQDPAVLEKAAAPQAETVALHHLYAKTQGYPWLLKVIFYLNHQAKLDFYTLNRILEGETDHNPAAGASLSVAAFVRYVCRRLPDRQRQVFQTLCFIRHPVDMQTLQALVSVCYPMLGASPLSLPALEDMVEHGLFKPMLKVSYPPQEVLERVRLRREQNESEERKFQPWYELYHAVKRMLYLSLPVEERARIHAVLQDFYLNEKMQETENRLFAIKNRALLAEAKYHGSAARERKPVLAETVQIIESPPPSSEISAAEGSSAVVDAASPGTADLATSKAYLYRHMKPMGGQQYLTLEDYRRINLPEVAEAVPVQADFQKALADLDLSEEERHLLYGTDAPVAALAENAESRLQAVKPVEPKITEAAPSVSAGETASSLPEGLMAEEHQADERERVIQKRLAAAVAARDQKLMLTELLELARYRAAHGRYQAAGQCLEKALSLNVNTGKETLAEIYRLSGMVYKETYHHNAALKALAKAAVYIKRLMYEDDTVNMLWLSRLGQVYQNLGEIHGYRKQYGEAIEAFNQALRWYHSADDKSHEAEVYFQLADVYDYRQDAANAIAYYEKALILDEAQGNHMSAAAALANLGNLYYETDEIQQALRCYQRSLDYDRRNHNTEGQLNTLEWLVNLYLDQDQIDRAEAICRQGLAIALQEGRDLWKASFYMKLGQLATESGNWKEALSHFQSARAAGENELSRESLDWIDQKIAEARSR